MSQDTQQCMFASSPSRLTPQSKQPEMHKWIENSKRCIIGFRCPRAAALETGSPTVHVCFEFFEAYTIIKAARDA